jgi:hypothetical protein
MITGFLFRALDRQAIWVAWHLLLARRAICRAAAQPGCCRGSPAARADLHGQLVGKYLTYALLALASI